MKRASSSDHYLRSPRKDEQDKKENMDFRTQKKDQSNM